MTTSQNKTTRSTQYKQTEVGLIPQDWDVKRLGNVGQIATGNTPPTADRTNYGEEFMFVSPADLGSKKWIRNTEKRLSKKGFELSRHFPVNSILFTCIGSTIGKSGIASELLTSNQQINAIFPSEDIHFQYVYYSLNNISELIKSRAGEQAVPLVNKTEFSLFQIPLPPTLSEQQAIATALSDVDALISNLEQRITKKKAIKQGAMQQLLTPPHLGGKRLAGFSGEWVKKTLGEVAVFFKGKGLPKSEININGKKNCIHYGELFTKYNEVIKTVKSKTNTSEDVFTSLKNDVLMPTSDVTPNGLATASALYQSGVVLGGDVLVIRPIEKMLLAGFLSYQISINKSQIMSLISGTTVYHLYGSDMKKFIFFLPSLKEQTAIVEVLESINNQLETLESQKAKYQEIKQGMMQELLTGKTRLV